MAMIEVIFQNYLNLYLLQNQSNEKIVPYQKESNLLIDIVNVVPP